MHAGHGYQGDLHEFVITDRDTALVSIANAVTVDLTSLGGASDAQVVEGVVQEIDIASGKCPVRVAQPRPRPAGRVLSDGADRRRQRRLLPPERDRRRQRRQPARLVAPHLLRLQARPHDRGDHLAARRQAERLLVRRGAGSVPARRTPAAGRDADALRQRRNRGQAPSERARAGLRLALDPGHDGCDARAASTCHRRRGSPSRWETSRSCRTGTSSSAGAPRNGFTEYSKDGKVLYDASFADGSVSYRAFRIPWTATPAAAPRLFLAPGTAA